MKFSALRHDANGNEILSEIPMQPPLGYRRTPTLAEQIRQQVRQAKLEFLDDGTISETDEDADDFEVGDDFEPLSPHENDHIPSIAELKKQASEINEEISKRIREGAVADYVRKYGKEPPKTPVPPVEDRVTPPPPPVRGEGA